MESRRPALFRKRKLVPSSLWPVCDGIAGFAWVSGIWKNWWRNEAWWWTTLRLGVGFTLADGILDRLVHNAHELKCAATRFV